MNRIIVVITILFSNSDPIREPTIGVLKVLHAYFLPSLSSMAEPLKKTHQTNPRSSCFLGCFGFSGQKKPVEKPIQTGTKKNPHSLSWPMFRLSLRKSRTKTVPVDNTDKAEADHSHTPKLIKKKSDGKLSSKPQSPTNHKPSRQNSKAEQQLTSSNRAARETPKETRLQGPEPNIIPGNRKLLDPTSTGSSLPGSPKMFKTKPQPKTQTKLFHTVSSPVLEGNQRVGNPRIHARTNLKELQRKNNEVVEKLDSMMGMSIIMVTLIIMLLWGRLCAILCTSAWFYFCPSFRPTINNNDTTVKSTANSNDLDLDSEDYKKKVVLEGLLERNHRITL
ncbi:uncharacterized protein At5g23160-like [Durio zibethinus]|uniref:Uncharacterized protein At5g23160-like n=1 Tax=Durio zibethinus TaxID=66656 RepID=A0A6P6AC69_DURZI|nr:uncharacterized protein At5g23160-like [Durio zibethinus]